MPGPVVVQRALGTTPNSSGSWTPTVTFSGAPANGNLLVAIVHGTSSALTAATGWTVDASYSSGSHYVASFYKYAGASESTTQTPVTTAETLASIVMWEVTNIQGAWSKDHVASTGGASSSTASTDSVSLTTSSQDELILGGWVGNCTVGTGGAPSGTLSSLNLALQQPNNDLGGTTPVYMMAMMGEKSVVASGTVVTDNWAFSVAAYNNKVYVQLTSDYLPANTQGVSQITGYTSVGPVPNTQNAAQITGYTAHGAPTGTQQVAQITGYIMVVAAQTSPGWISVME